MSKRRKNKTRVPVAALDQLSLAERAFLFNDEREIDKLSEPELGWARLHLKGLRSGYQSWHRGRSIDPWQLGEQYGHLLPPERREALEAELEDLKYHEVLKPHPDGPRKVRILRRQFQEPSTKGKVVVPLRPK